MKQVTSRQRKNDTFIISMARPIDVLDDESIQIIHVIQIFQRISEIYKDHHLKDPSSCISSEQLDQTWAADPTPPKMRPTWPTVKTDHYIANSCYKHLFSFCPFLG